MGVDLVQLNMGEVAEWFKAAVLKTVDPQGSGGSNPSLSAISVVCARRPWRYVFVFDRPRPVHPGTGVRLFPAHPPISFHVYSFVESPLASGMLLKQYIRSAVEALIRGIIPA